VSTLVAILAAGESKRMGQPKLCLPWGDTTILGHLLAQWREAGAANILVVHGPGETPVSRELDRLGVANRIVNSAMERGMMGSIITAAASAMTDKTLTHLVISLGDQPRVRIETLRELLRACDEAPGQVIRLIHDGKAGHPLALPATMLPELSATPAATLRDFLRLKEMPSRDLTSGDFGILLDVDTPDDYRRATDSAR
jgi:molybdenum cofactor cytidylyltransferase